MHDRLGDATAAVGVLLRFYHRSFAAFRHRCVTVAIWRKLTPSTRICGWAQDDFTVAGGEIAHHARAMR
jgi:hypothetical protein